MNKFLQSMPSFSSGIYQNAIKGVGKLVVQGKPSDFINGGRSNEANVGVGSVAFVQTVLNEDNTVDCLGLTCFHVVENGEAMYTTTSSDENVQYGTTVLRCIPQLDLATVLIKGLNVPKDHLLSIRDKSYVPKQGDSVVAIGVPLGGNQQISTGVISTFQDGQIVINGSMNSGNSGGPVLLLKEGKLKNVIGLVSNKPMSMMGPAIEGIVNCVPIYHTWRDDIWTKSDKKVIYLPELLADVQSFTSQQNLFLNNPVPDGVGLVVTNMLDSSNLQKVGVGQGDVLISLSFNLLGEGENEYILYNNSSVKPNMKFLPDTMKWTDLLKYHNADQPVKLKWYSKNQNRIVTNSVNLVDQSVYGFRKMYPDFEQIGYLRMGGMTIMRLSLEHFLKNDPIARSKLELLYGKSILEKEHRLPLRVVITDISVGTEIHQAQSISPWTVISEINDVPISTINDAIRALSNPIKGSSGNAFVKIVTDDHKMFLTSVHNFVDQDILDYAKPGRMERKRTDGQKKFTHLYIS